MSLIFDNKKVFFKSRLQSGYAATLKKNCILHIYLIWQQQVLKTKTKNKCALKKVLFFTKKKV